MNDAERGIAVLHIVGDDAQREQVVDLVDRDSLLLELQVDGIEPLDAGLRTSTESRAPSVLSSTILRNFGKKRFVALRLRSTISFSSW